MVVLLEATEQLVDFLVGDVQIVLDVPLHHVDDVVLDVQVETAAEELADVAGIEQFGEEEGPVGVVELHKREGLVEVHI